MDIVSLAKPDGWIDRSMIAYSAPNTPKSGVAPNIVVTKDKITDIAGSTSHEKIESFALKQISEMKGKLSHPIILVQQPTVVSEKPAFEVYVSWLSGRLRVTQWVIFIAVDLEQAVICTSTAAESEFADYRDYFHGIVQNLQFSK